MYLVETSASATEDAPASATSDPIHLVTQFYMPHDPERMAEVREALRRNVTNPFLDSVTLLNERFYTADELGITSPKIIQTLLPHRVKFSELFAPRYTGYTVVANADIFLDQTIANVRSTNLHTAKRVFSLLRYEFTTPRLEDCPIFGPRADSADTWVLHSANPLPLNLFQFEMGRPGCDNKLNYLFRLLGFDVCNDPTFVRTYHCHKSAERQYALAAVPAPYMLSVPFGVGCGYRGHPLEEVRPLFSMYDMEKGNERLRGYIAEQDGKPFVIPRIAGIENNTAVHYTRYEQGLPQGALDVLKNNAGLGLESPNDMRSFSLWYMKAFERCEVFASWEPWGHYIKHIEHSQQYMQTRFRRRQLTTGVFDVFHFVAGGKPWTHALQGKKVLLISPFGELFLRQKQAYPVDLFPDCTFSCLKPPMTQGAEPNRGFEAEFQEFCAKVKKCDFDVALCSCGGYGNPICAYIHTLGKSAIYVGGVLQMYFGVYGGRWIKERKDVLNLYMTKEWKRPKERPKGYERIEDGCYW